MAKNKTAVIGAGFSGLSAAIHLAHEGNEVHLYEKHDIGGGRARQFNTKGFTFDMGPSWYWMPDVFDDFFKTYGHQTADFYQLTRLDPAFRIYFGKDNVMDVPDNEDALYHLFEAEEQGSAKKLKKFMKGAAYKYKVGVHDLVHKPSTSIFEFFDLKLMIGAVRLQLFNSFRKHVKQYFKSERLQKLMEFPVLFLGATPQNTPALYSLMNYAGLMLGTFYPQGGFHKVIQGMQQLAETKGVHMHFNTAVEQIVTDDKLAVALKTSKRHSTFKGIISGADYHFTEQHLLEEKHRNYQPDYWEKRTMAPSSLLFYLGIDKKVDSIQHHNLFFDEDFDRHAFEIYEDPQWPTKPLFYVCCPSKTDDTVAPEACENLFFLMPLAPGIQDDETLREEYFQHMMNRFEQITGEAIQDHIIYKKSYGVNNFVEDYHAFKGNAYGLANTLKQTAILKPSIRNKKLPNLFYTGQLTVPGPGVPPSLISGQVAAKELMKYLNKN